MELVFNDFDNKSDQLFIEEQLLAYNSSRISGYSFDSFTYKMLDGTKEIKAAIHCQISGGWLYIVGLWVDERLRGNGFGKKLLAAAERKAIEKGCHGAYLYSYSFQVPEFYKKQGYEAFGRLDNYCGDNAKVFFQKPLGV